MIASKSETRFVKNVQRDFIIKYERFIEQCKHKLDIRSM